MRMLLLQTWCRVTYIHVSVYSALPARACSRRFQAEALMTIRCIAKLWLQMVLWLKVRSMAGNLDCLLSSQKTRLIGNPKFYGNAWKGCHLAIRRRRGFLFSQIVLVPGQSRQSCPQCCCIGSSRLSFRGPTLALVLDCAIHISWSTWSFLSLEMP